MSSKKSDKPTFWGSFFFVITGCVVSFFLANITAYLGCRAAGVSDGGWNWQFIGAFIVGSFYGPLSFVCAFFYAAKKIEDRFLAFVAALGGSALSAFAVSWTSYLLYR